MSSDFRDSISQVVMGMKKNAKAWLGALQFLAYSQPDMSRRAEQGAGDTQEVASDVQRSSVAWFEATKEQLEAAFKSAEGTLSNEWAKHRDPRYNTPEAEVEFAHRFEANLATIAKLVLDTEKDMAKGGLRQNKAARESLGWIKNDLRRLFKVYDDHCYEMTMQKHEGDLLSLRASILDGNSRAL